MQHREIEISIKIIPKRIKQRTSANFVLNDRSMDSRLKFRKHENIWKIYQSNISNTRNLTHFSFGYANRSMDSRLKFRCLKTGEYLKNLATKNLYKILEIAFFGLFDIVEYFQRANLASEQHCPIVVNTYISSPTPINLISFLGSVFLGSGVSYLFFHPLCARVGCTHRIRVTGLYVETFHPREVRGGGGEIDFPFIRGNVGYVARTRDESLRLPQRKSLSTSTRAESWGFNDTSCSTASSPRVPP